MEVAIILTGSFQILTMVGVCLFVRRFLNHKQAEMEQKLQAVVREWIEPQGEGRPSKFAALLDVGGGVIGAAAARSIMSALNAEKGHTARAAGDIGDQLQAQANPLLGLLAGGRRGKGAALTRLAEILGPMLTGGAAAPAPSGNGQKQMGMFDRISKGGH